MKRPAPLGFALLLLLPTLVWAEAAGQVPALLGIRVEFIVFGLTLAGVVLWHRHTLAVVLCGLVGLVGLKLSFTDFDLGTHLHPEWRLLLNLLGLLTGFALLARHLEASRIPRALTQLLPETWEGSFILLFAVFVLSTFLDNIAAALIGGTLARAMFGDRVHLGFLAAIVVASNAGGVGSVLGAFTTTMMWASGVPAIAVAPAVVGGLCAFTLVALVAAFQQDRLQGAMRPPLAGQ